MNFEEFLNPADEEVETEESVEVAEPEELDVQKAVVESLAAEKVAQDEEIKRLKEENGELRKLAEAAEKEKVAAKSGVDALKNEIAAMKKTLEETGDILAKNSENEMSSKIALLDRNLECGDRFPGETRDHVIEVLREARDKAEAEGRSRRAQLLEAVLLENEPNGTLAKRREELEKIFKDNGNIVSGAVMEELEKRDIPYKRGDTYLLVSEIINNVY